MPLSNVIWPEQPVPEAIKTWISNLFTLLDSHDEDAPQKAAALYTPDAVVYGMAGKATGTQGISPSPLLLVQYICLDMHLTVSLPLTRSTEIIAARANSWNHMESRQHSVLRVYSSKVDGSDLLIIGNLKAKFKNGKEAEDQFIIRLTFEGDTSVAPKGSLYQIWADSAIWLKAIRGD
jgi:hypothetical protein